MRKHGLIIFVMVTLVGTLISAQPLAEEPATMAVNVEHEEDAVSDYLLYMAEEEKLARDVYLALYEMWGSRVFSNIAKAEQLHMDALSAVLHDKGHESVQTEVGVFHNTEIATLYESLLAQGSVSVQEAYRVGAIVEDLDIYDLKQAIDETDDEVEIWVYNNLLRGSESHMRAFVRQLNRSGLEYTARYISDAELSSILSRL